MTRFHKLALVFLGSLLSLTCASAQGVHMWYDDAHWKQGMQQSIQSFYGSHVGSYVGYGLTESNDSAAERTHISNQFMTVFFGVPAGKETLSGGQQLYAFSKPHDGLIKAVAVTVPGSTTLLATALLHYSCGKISPASASSASLVSRNFARPCNKVPTFTIFYKTAGDKNPQITTDLLTWARSKSPKFKYEVVVLN